MLLVEYQFNSTSFQYHIILTQHCASDIHLSPNELCFDIQYSDFFRDSIHRYIYYNYVEFTFKGDERRYLGFPIPSRHLFNPKLFTIDKRFYRVPRSR